MHIVLIRFSSIGDVVLQTSLVAKIKEKYSHAKITFITDKVNAVFLNDHPDIDDVLTYEKKRGPEDLVQLKNLAKDLKLSGVDIVIDLHNTLRAKLLRFLSPTLVHVKVNKRSIWRMILVRFKINFLKDLPSQHERLILDFSHILNLPMDLNQFPLTRIAQSNLEVIHKTKTIILAPVASFASKRWPMDSFSQLIQNFMSIENFPYTIKIIGGPNDSFCQDILCPDKRVENLQGKLNLEQTIELINKSDLVIGNDTGMGHIAESLGVPVVTLFGSTSPSFGFKPHLPTSEYIYMDWSCSPCSATGKKPCSRPTHECMLAITPELVLEKSLLVLGRVK